MKLITAVKEQAHITPLMDAMCNRGVAGNETCAYNKFENFEPQIVSNNEVRIRSGAGMIQGRQFCIEPNTYDAVTIANGTQGEKRIDLIVARFEADSGTATQDADWAVIQGTPAASDAQVPEHTVGDIDDGDLIAEEPWIEVELDGINIVEVRQVFTTISGLGDVRAITEGGTGANNAADARDNLLAGSGITTQTLLWENASLDSTFNAQTMILNGLSEYDQIEVEYTHLSTSSTVRASQIIKNVVGNKILLTCSIATLGYGHRLGEISSNSIVWSDAKFNETSGGAANKYNIPYLIYGIKTL